MLALAHVGMQLYGFAVAAMESLVLVEYGLHDVFAGRHIFEAADGIAGGPRVHDGGLRRLPAIDGEAEDHLRARCVVDLITRLVAWVGREQEKQAAVERL